MTGFRILGGGGGGSAAGSLSVGPQFGGTSPYHPRINAALSHGQLDFSGNLATNAALSLFSVDPTYNAGAFAAQDLSAVDLAGNLSLLAALSFQIDIDRFNTTDDAWIEQANPDTNHGSDTDLQVRSDNSLGNGEERALIEFDFTVFSNLTASGGCDFVCYANENAVLGSVDMTIQFRSFGSDAFDEDTVTWNNATNGTAEFTKTTTVGDATFQEQRISISQSEVNQMLGKFIVARCISTNSVDTPQLNVKSKEATDSTQHPRFENITLVAA